MNSDHDLEELLGRLSPAPPGPELMERLRAARPPEKKPRPVFLRFWLPLSLAAAAGVVFAWLVQDPSPVTQPVAEKPKRETLQPVGSVQHLMEVADLGVVVGEDDQPVRLIRTRWIDEILYAPDGGEPFKEGRLREEVLPVSLDLY